MYADLAILAVIAFLYSTIAGGLERTPFSGPLLFIVVGIVIGPMGLGWFQPNLTSHELRILADLTLALVLFIDAANADVGVLKRQVRIPRRMLLLGLPGVIALGIGVGALVFDQLTGYEVVILAVMLAATDAALGKAVVTNKSVPARVREGLNLESGLNDGICVPVLFVFIALAKGGAGDEGGSTAQLALRLVGQELGIGLVVGLGLAYAGVWIMRFCWSRGWRTEIWAQLPVITLAVACFAVAQSLHGSGYIAAFGGGLLFGILAKEKTHDLVLAAEGTGETLALVTWIMFGVAALDDAFDYFNWQVVLYAVLSLTVIRMLPIFVSLTGTGERAETKLFLAWFGPRGLASIVFAIIVVNEGLPGARFMALVVASTVFLSVLAHGVSANPLASVFAARMRRVEESD